MSSPLVIQANYDQLQRIAQRFAEQSQQIAALRNDLSHRTSALRDGGWEGQGAIAFFAEMDRDLLPGLLRLREALQEASEVTLAIRTLLQVAEEEAAALFTNGAAADGAADGRDFWWNARDFLSGMWAEAKETVEGTITMVRHPIQSAQALLYGIRHPGELWNAIKQPYVEDWNNGHKWRAIGRGTMAIIAAAVGSKGVDKVAKLAKAGRFGGGASRAASAAARFGSFRRVVAGAKVSKIDNVLDLLRPSTARATRVADEIAEAVNKGLPYDHLIDDLAHESSVAIKTPSGAMPDRVVLGAWQEHGIEDFYIRQAHGGGGIIYNTGNEAWHKLAGIGDEATRRRVQWEVNQRFLQQQMDEGVPRIEYVSADLDEITKTRFKNYLFDEVVDDFIRNEKFSVDNVRITFRELEVLYMRDQVKGYKLVGSSWVKLP